MGTTTTEHMVLNKRKNIKYGETVLGLIAGYLLVSYFVIYLFDIRGLGNLGETMDSPIWAHIFQEAGPTELLQWLTLGSFSIVSAYVAGLYKQLMRFTESKMWFFMAILGIILVIEDAGNTSHIVRNFFGTIGLDTLRNLGRLMVYGVYGAVAVYPLALYFIKQKSVLNSSKNFKYILIGYTLYAIVAFTSASQSALTVWYAPIGDYLLDTIGNGSLSFTLPVDHWADSAGHLFMDTVVEESVELLSASFLLAGSLVCLKGLASGQVSEIKGAKE